MPNTKVIGQSFSSSQVSNSWMPCMIHYSFLNTGSPPSFNFILLSSLLTLSSPLNKHSRVSGEFKFWENPSLARISVLEWGMIGDSRQLLSLRLSMATASTVCSHEWSKGCFASSHGLCRSRNWLVWKLRGKCIHVHDCGSDCVCQRGPPQIFWQTIISHMQLSPKWGCGMQKWAW